MMRNWRNAVQLDVLVDSSSTGEADRSEGHAVGPADPQIPQPVKRRQHYPFYSRPPDGAEITTLAPFGGSNNREYISSHVYGAVPELADKGDAAIATINGQKIQMFKDGRLTLSTGHGSKAELMEDGSVVLTAANGKATLKDGTLTVEDAVVAQDVTAKHFLGGGAAPTVAASSALGGGGSAALMPGATDAAFVLQLTAGMSPSPGEVCTVTFSRSYGTQPRGVNVTGASLEALTAPIAGAFGYDAAASSDTVLSILCGAALTNGVTYYVSVSIIR